ncbi:MAG: 3-phosphoshikimate 1-carboxyvinyltransferase [Clostridiaceae bacterium]|jgi:3-phosphoshikimate 1-carboxyvinyltransferase|nr:3-phosphoshikimate 1-carboxyvinyltransferase [Clostridiaceae bacterium]
MLIESRSALRGEITVPSDKSISHRAVVAGALAGGTTQIDNFLLSEDCINTIECFRKMSIGIDILSNSKIRVHGKGLYGLKMPGSILNAGRSGTALRLLLGVLSAQQFNSNLTRNEDVMKKPVGAVAAYLQQMGANISGKEDGNFCPLAISPVALKGSSFDISSLETNIKSPLLLASLYAEGETTITEAVKSRNHTELMLNYFGADIKTDGLRVISHRVENLYARNVSIPGDISMAAYFITAGLLVANSDILIKNVGVNPTRTQFINVYRTMGAKIEIVNERTINNEPFADIHVKASELKGTKIDGQLIPCLLDELTVMIVAAAFAKGTTEVSGISGFKIEQSGKLKAIAMELSKMGAKISEIEDGLVIEGREGLRGTVVESRNNYSLAMALSVAGLAAEGETMIRKTQAVDIVYPEFFSTLNKL